MQQIILASKSPRRQELIRRITDDFEVIVSEADETLPADILPEEAAVYLSAVKAGAVAADRPDRLVVGADTVVILDGQVLGKPRDKDDAAAMLHALSGRIHTVVTGCMSAGRVYDKINDEYFARIKFITGQIAIAKILSSDEYIKEVENPESDINFLSDNLGKIDLEFIEKNFKGEGNDN